MMTYLEWRTANPTVLTEKTELDEATIQLLSDWFDSRFLCDDDNFERFFVRQINLDYWQYNQLLRLQSVEFDPMVSQYLERWVNRTGTQDNTSKTTGKTSDSGTGSSTVQGTVSSTPGVTETSETTRTPNTTTTSTSTPGVRESTETIHKPNTTVTSTGSSDGDSSGSSETTGSTTETSNNTGTNSQETTSSTNTRALSGVLPDSSTYAPTGGDNPNTDITGFPNALNWTYASSQNGSVGQDSSSVTGTNATNVNSEGSSTSNVTDSTTTHTESESTTTTSGTDTTTVATTRTGSDETTTHSTGTETTVVETSRTGSDQSTNNTTTTSEDQRSGTSETDVTGSSSFDHTDKEISTGRGEAPQDMLQRAKSYIVNMNAFEWLVKDLDKCFLGVYNI